MPYSPTTEACPECLSGDTRERISQEYLPDRKYRCASCEHEFAEPIERPSACGTNGDSAVQTLAYLDPEEVDLSGGVDRGEGIETDGGQEMEPEELVDRTAREYLIPRSEARRMIENKLARGSIDRGEGIETDGAGIGTDAYDVECSHCGAVIDDFSAECPACGFNRREFRLPSHDPETSCIECGKEAHMFCGCCGFPLCGMHHELGAGFCTSYFSVGGVPLCIYDHDVYVGVWPRDEHVLVSDADSDVFHLPDDKGAHAPACRPQEDSKTAATLETVQELDRELCEHCETEARQRHEKFQAELAEELGGEGS